MHYIEQHLYEPLTVEHLSRVAGWLKYHFHRQFSAEVGVGLGKYVRLMRLKKAAYQLVYRSTRITEIAHDAGFDSPEAFARAFKTVTQLTPSQFRKQPNWLPWQGLKRTAFQGGHSTNVDVVCLPAIRVAVLEHEGSISQLSSSILNFIDWRKANRCPPATSDSYNFIYHDPKEVAERDYRVDICAAINFDVLPNDQGVVQKEIPAGDYACLLHEGSWDGLERSVRYLYGCWLPASNHVLADFPCVFQYLNFIPDVE